MDAVQFGRWIANRRRAYGYRSQRALVSKIQTNHLPFDLTHAISEDFLARLEAGQLAHPFRGSVRQRVLALAWHLCQTPRDIKTYLKAAELSQLDTSEQEQMQLLQDQLGPRSAIPSLPLPPRPAYLVGRSSQVQDLIHALRTTETGLCMITGMPGVGKSALAYETIHILASDQLERTRSFPDGIAAFTALNRKGDNGLISLLQDIATAFNPSYAEQAASSLNAHSDIAATIDRCRMALAGKRALLLIDELEMDFPLRQALESLLGHKGIVVLATSRFVPAPALMSYHLHLAPLTQEAALELFIILLKRSLLSGEEQQYAEQICAALGNLPLALEVAAATVIAGGVTLPLLAASLTRNPLDPLLDGEYELRSRLSSALESLEPDLQKQFALLSALGVPSFGLESAAALRISTSETGEHMVCLPARNETTLTTLTTLPAQDTVVDSSAGENGYVPLPLLTATASDLERFVRRSLLDLEGPAINAEESTDALTFNHTHTDNHTVRYRMHPLLRAHALKQLDPESLTEAERNTQSYALSYLKRYQNDVPLLRQERDFLLASVQRAFYSGQYQQVIQLLDRLIPLCRLYGRRECERLLHWGIEASQQRLEMNNLAKYLFHLGDVFCMHGELTRARQIFEDNLEMAKKLQNSDYVWLSLCNLAHIAHAQGESDMALHLTETHLQRMRNGGTPDCIIEAAYLHGFYARLQGKMDTAYKDIALGLQLFSQRDKEKYPFYARLLDLQLKTEMARIRGDYAETREYVEIAAQALRETWRGYLLADLLFDQACFAFSQGQYGDAEQLARRVAQIALEVQAPHFYSLSIQLLQKLPGPARAYSYSTSPRRIAITRI